VKDNLVLKQQIQELEHFADGVLSSSRMPEHWTLEEQNMALKLVLRVIREGLCGEKVLQIIIEENDYPDLIRLANVENELLAQELRGLERKVIELTANIAEFEEFEENGVDNNTERLYSETQQFGNIEVQGHVSSNDDEQFATISDLRDDQITKIETHDCVVTPQTHFEKKPGQVTSTKAKLKRGNKKCSSPNMLRTSPDPPVLMKSDDECGDVQSRLLKARRKLDEGDQLMEKEIASKFDKGTKGENEEDLLSIKPCQVVLTGLGWGGIPPTAVELDANSYEGVTQVKIEGDVAMVHFRSVEQAMKYKGHGEYHVIEGYALGVGDIILLDNDTKEYPTVQEKEIISSVAVRVKKRGGIVRSH